MWIPLAASAVFDRTLTDDGKPTEEFCIWLQRAQVSNGEQPVYLQGDDYLRCVAGFISDAT